MTSTDIIRSRVSDIADFTKRHDSLIESAGHHYVEDITHLLLKIQELEDRIREMEETPDEDTVSDGLKAATELIAHYLTANDGLWEANAKLQAEIPRWIPVGEGLPERGERILALSSEGVVKSYQNWIFPFPSTVTHWMTLPALPGKGEPNSV